MLYICALRKWKKQALTVNKFINFVFFQVLWFACIVGAASGVVWPGFVVLGLFLVWQLQPSRIALGDIRLILVAILLGILLDSLWPMFGVLSFATPVPLPSFAPVWIIFLWIGFALTINHSLAWLKEKLVIAVVLSFVAAPLSYFGGHRLGALDFTMSVPMALLLLAFAWAIAFPLLVMFARYMQNKPQSSKALV